MPSWELLNLRFQKIIELHLILYSLRGVWAAVNALESKRMVIMNGVQKSSLNVQGQKFGSNRKRMKLGIRYENLALCIIYSLYYAFRLKNYDIEKLVNPTMHIFYNAPEFIISATLVLISNCCEN